MDWFSSPWTHTMTRMRQNLKRFKLSSLWGFPEELIRNLASNIMHLQSHMSHRPFTIQKLLKSSKFSLSNLVLEETFFSLFKFSHLSRPKWVMWSAHRLNVEHGTRRPEKNLELGDLDQRSYFRIVLGVSLRSPPYFVHRLGIWKKLVGNSTTATKMIAATINTIAIILVLVFLELLPSDDWKKMTEFILSNNFV